MLHLYSPLSQHQLYITLIQKKKRERESDRERRKKKTQQGKVMGRKMKWLSGPSRKSVARSSRQAIFPQLLPFTETRVLIPGLQLKGCPRYNVEISYCNFQDLHGRVLYMCCTAAEYFTCQSRTLDLQNQTVINFDRSFQQSSNTSLSIEYASIHNVFLFICLPSDAFAAIPYNVYMWPKFNHRSKFTLRPVAIATLKSTAVIVVRVAELRLVINT